MKNIVSAGILSPTIYFFMFRLVKTPAAGVLILVIECNP